jgi:hypothetical protein
VRLPTSKLSRSPVFSTTGCGVRLNLSVTGLRNQRLGNIHVDRNLGGGTAPAIDLPQSRPDRPQRQRVIDAYSIDTTQPCDNM